MQLPQVSQLTPKAFLRFALQTNPHILCYTSGQVSIAGNWQQSWQLKGRVLFSLHVKEPILRFPVFQTKQRCFSFLPRVPAQTKPTVRLKPKCITSHEDLNSLSEGP